MFFCQQGQKGYPGPAGLPGEPVSIFLQEHGNSLMSCTEKRFGFLSRHTVFTWRSPFDPSE